MNNYLIIILATLFIAFVISYSRVWYSLIRSKKEAAKLLVKTIVLEEYIRGFEDKIIQSDESIHKENFIKFLSESRDWAYEYIENVQDSLANFVSSVDSDIQHFDEYGDVLSTNRPDYEAMKRISSAYKELKKLLPEEENK